MPGMSTSAKSGSAPRQIVLIRTFRIRNTFRKCLSETPFGNAFPNPKHLSESETGLKAFVGADGSSRHVKKPVVLLSTTGGGWGCPRRRLSRGGRFSAGEGVTYARRGGGLGIRAGRTTARLLSAARPRAAWVSWFSGLGHQAPAPAPWGNFLIGNSLETGVFASTTGVFASTPCISGLSDGPGAVMKAPFCRE